MIREELLHTKGTFLMFEVLGRRPGPTSILPLFVITNLHYATYANIATLLSDRESIAELTAFCL